MFLFCFSFSLAFFLRKPVSFGRFEEKSNHFRGPHYLKLLLASRRPKDDFGSSCLVCPQTKWRYNHKRMPQEDVGFCFYFSRKTSFQFPKSCVSLLACLFCRTKSLVPLPQKSPKGCVCACFTASSRPDLAHVSQMRGMGSEIGMLNAPDVPAPRS